MRFEDVIGISSESTCYCLIRIISVGLLVFGFIFKQIPYPQKIAIVYSQPNKWYYLKYWTFYLLLKLRKLQSRMKNDSNESTKDAGLGLKSRKSIEDMDRIQELPEVHKKAVDAVYFNGANKEGVYFVCATARRHNHLVQTLLYIRFPDLGLLELPSLPDTCLIGDKPMSYSAGGVVIDVVEPMKHWRLSFNGPLRLTPIDGGSQQQITASFTLDWVAYTPCFDFDTDLYPLNICDGMAREIWSAERFNDLKYAHQTHYEQFGEICGTIKLGTYGERQLRVQGVRDHSYGNLRDWRDFHRYAIQYLHLEDGKTICIGNICMPRTMSRLIIGYVFHPNGQMDCVKSCDLHLHEMGEDGNDPTNFIINFTAGSTKYHLEGVVVDRPIFYMGWDWETRIHERMCTYKVNNIPGWGISEWCYRNYTGRPQSQN